MFQIPLDAEGRQLGFSPDSAYLVVGDADGHRSIWDISTLTMNEGYMRFNEFVGNVAMSPTGDWLAASDKGEVWLLDPEQVAAQSDPKGRLIVDFAPDVVTEIKVSPNGDSFAVATQSGQVVLIDVQGGTRTLISSGPKQALSFSPDGNTLFMGSEDGQLQYRSINAGDNGSLWQTSSAIYSVAVSATGQIALGMDDKIVLLESASNPLEKTLSAPGKNQHILFDPDGLLLVSGTTLGRTYLWNLKDNEFKPLTELASGPVSSMSFTPSGDRLFLGETDQILIFDPLTGGEMNRIRQKGDVADLTFSPDGKMLFAAALRTIQFFGLTAMNDISGADILASACSRLTQNFSISEWTFFFEEEDYRQLCESLPVP
jgi:WD40 repeat protein